MHGQSVTPKRIPKSRGKEQPYAYHPVLRVLGGLVPSSGKEGDKEAAHGRKDALGDT